MRLRGVGGIVLAFFATAGTAGAVTRTVGPGGTYATPCAAIAAAQSGDTIDIDAAGSYTGDVCEWSTSDLTIEGVNGRPRIDDTGHPTSAGKAIWVIDGANTTVKNVELSGASNPDSNGAAIRLQGTGLTIVGSYFHDNQEGILTNDDAASDVVIDSSEFAHNGAGDGQSHNIYIGNVRSFVLRYSWSHDVAAGHLVKSRALANTIVYNRLTQEGGDGSYELDLPNGGPSTVMGNLFEKASGASNTTLLSFGAETPLHSDSRLSAVNNTFVNDRTSPVSDTAIKVASSVPVLAQNNISTGFPTFVSGGVQTLTTNCVTDNPGFVSRSTFDYHLTDASPCRTAGSPPSSELTPTQQYVHPLGHETRTDGGTIAGALGSVPVSPPADTTPPPASSTTTPSTSPTTAPSTTTPLPDTAHTAPALAKTPATVTVRNGKLRIVVRCAKSVACRGVLVLRYKGKKAGTAKFNARTAHRAVVVIKVRGRLRTALVKRASVKVAETLTLRGHRPIKRTIVVRRPR